MGTTLYPVSRDTDEKRMTILLLAAIDMEQVIQAAEAIQRELQSSSPRLQFIRALETAVAVCYWRPFSASNTVGCLRHKDAEDPDLHKEMKRIRNQVHAHTQTSWWAEGGRGEPRDFPGAETKRGSILCL
jgi:hypothetical protein